LEQLTKKETESVDLSAARYTRERMDYWDQDAIREDRSVNWGRYYHQRLLEIYRALVPAGSRVVELGCGQGDLLAGLEPAVGIGIDFSSNKIARARQKYHQLVFLQADAHEIHLEETFDYIILSDLLSDLWDIQRAFEQVRRLCQPTTRVIVNTYSRLWEMPLLLGQKLGVARPVLQRNWLTVEDIASLENLAGLEVIRSWHEILFPFRVPLLADLFNRYLVKLWPFQSLALTNLIVSRPYPVPSAEVEQPLISVIVPARNEAGNIPHIFDRAPQMGRGTELVFVEGHSKDNTFAVIQEEMAKHPGILSQAVQQSGIGKGDAVRLGFARARGEVLMILDADLTVPPEDLPRFYNALVGGKGDLINGVRLVYPMEKQAMRFFNFLGNKFFTLAFSYLIGQPVKDTLCGTKVLWKKDYERIAANRAYFGDFDPFGDFDLIFGAARLNLKILDLPIRYRERKYGTTQIQRWKHGWLLIRMVGFAARRIKFI